MKVRANSDWREAILGDLIHLEYGKSLPATKRVLGRVPVYGSNGVVGWHDRAIVKGPGIVVGRKGTAGAVEWAIDDFWPIDTTYFVGRVDQDTDLRWLYYLLKHLRLDQLNAATGIPGLNRNDALALSVSIPPLAEQRKMAAILSSVDEAMEKTQAVIDQVQVVKKGLMQTLLTRGLPGRHTRFKHTAIGELPEEWEVVSVMDIPPSDRPPIQTGPFGAQLSSSEFIDFGVPVLKIGNVQWGSLVLKDLDYVSEAKAVELGKYRVKHGDLLFARQGATTGRNALATRECDGWLISYHIIRVAVDRKRCQPEFLSMCFNSQMIQSQVGRNKGRGNRDGINTTDISSFLFPLPPMEEQETIIDLMTSVSRVIETNNKRKSGLLELKIGLMAALLSGEMRVSVEGERYDYSST